MKETPVEPVLEYVMPEIAAKRMNPAIKPTDPRWREVHDKFALLLEDKNKTIQQILAENFTRHETRLFVPSDRPEIKELHNWHAARYKVLREGRFKAVEPTLSVKLTMLYFGVPVEPMDSPLDEMAAFLDSREPVGPVFEVAPPLHFLTAHKHRNWGDDALRAREDRIMPVPIQPNLAPVVSLRGGAAGEEEPQNGVDTVDYVPAGEEADDPNDDWVNLYGVQGCIPFVPYNWRSFSAAVRQLLSLRFQDARARHFVFVHFDKRTHQVLNHVKEPLPLTKDSPVFQFIQKHCASEWHDDDCCAFYVKTVTDRRRDHVWEPQSEQFKADLAKISYPVFDKTRDPEQKIVRHAYLAFPRTRDKETFSINGFNPDQFDAHFHTAVEVLTGRPKGSFLHGMYSLVDENGPKPTILDDGRHKAQFVRDRVSLLNYQGSYGGMVLKPSLWPLLHPLSNPKGRWTLHAAPMEKKQIAFVLPNTYLEIHPVVERQGGPGSTPWSGAHALIWALVNKKPLGQNEIPSLKEQVRLLPGGTALGEVIDHKEKGLVYPCPPGEDSAVELAKFLDRLVDTGAEPFVLIHPVYKPGAAVFLPSWWQNPSKNRCVDMPPLGSSLKDFTDSVRMLCKAADYEGQYNPDVDSVILESEYALVNGRLELSHIVITPETTEDDWYRARARITANAVQVKVQSQRIKDWKASISKSNTWGARISPGQGHWEPVDDATLRHNVRVVELENDPTRLTDAPPQRRGPGRGYRFGRDDNDVNVGESAGGDEFSWPPERPDSPNPIDSGERLSSYAVQPSIFDNFDKFQWTNGRMVLHRAPKIPINAAPKEPILRTTSSVPMVSKAILTPSEQARLQDDFWELRNMMLKRTAKCPYKGCDFTCRLDRKADMHDHLAKSHRTESCAFCSSPLWEFWDQTQRRDHLRTEHAAKLAGILGVPVPEPADNPGHEEDTEEPPRKRTFASAFSGFSTRRPGDPTLMAALKAKAASVTGTTPTEKRYHPKDRLRRLEHPLANWYDHRGRVQYKDPCVRCHIVACPKPDLEKLDAHDVYEHFDTLHPVAMAMCPFCDLPFEVSPKDDGGSKNRRPRDEIILHLDCHVNSLWDDLAARAPNASQSQTQTESYQAPEVESRDADRVFQIVRKCPFYDECGAVVQFMTPKQLRRHIRTEHAKDVHPPPPQASGLQGSFDRAQDDPEEHSESAARKSALKKPSRPAKTPLKRLPRPKTNRTPAASASASATEDSSGPSSTSKAATPRERHAKMTPGSKLRSVVQASIETDKTSEAEGSAGGSTGGTRVVSPDWDEVLDPEADDFLPDEGMYCSRCLRKVPKYADGNNDNTELSTADQMERHMAEDGCCRIRRGLGEPKSKLPNRSGWLPSSLRDLGKIKSKFLKEYPAYANTIYPTNKSDNNSSKWRSDPNNPDNKDAWGAPWPAVQGQPSPSVEEAPGLSRGMTTPFKGSEVSDPKYKDSGEDKSDNSTDFADDANDPQRSSRKRKRTKGPKNPLDPNYTFQKQDDPDDGLEPEFDDTKEFLESSPRLEDLADSGKGKRKRADTATTIYASAQPEAGPSRKKPKPSAAPEEALKTPARTLKPKPTPMTKGKSKTSAQSSAVPSRASSRQRVAREKSVASYTQGK
ncbi:hypothetical protein B0J13DRAFT_637460 [Dactylonectria estremocensis]|uniref:C2H2-type domain-containing protein n=1 Tax=Dactylonectria estremocensis TaxID=1079267 RepID=A0A9P9ELQ4_9HYPO|nr:hypothetical protein B0J13DRAFT_637460 [Dactylonectria estremocensis]